MPETPSRRPSWLWLFAAAALVILAAPFLGTYLLTPGDIWGSGHNEIHQTIFWSSRVPRVAVGVLVGATLAAGGVTFQALLRNPLAEPFTLGVSAGASAGMAISLVGGHMLGVSFSKGIGWFAENSPGDSAAFPPLFASDRVIGAFLGSLIAILAVYGISRLRGGLGTTALLLAGVAMSFFFSSLVMLAQFFATPLEAAQLARALMGRLDAGWRELAWLAPLTIPGLAIALLYRRELDLMSFGEELARTRGVDVVGARRILYFAVSLMTAGVAAFCGPIGFVGLMVPHAVRRWLGSGHHRLTPACLAVGAAFLVGADAIGRLASRWSALSMAEIPVGLVTALLGGPFFLWLLVSRAGSDGMEA